MNPIKHTIAWYSLREMGVNFKEAFDIVSSAGQVYASSKFPVHTNIINNVPKLSARERFYRTYYKFGDKQKKTALDPATRAKSIFLMKVFIARFLQPSDIEVDLFGGTFTTVIVALNIPDMRVFVRCDADVDWANHADRSCLNSFAKVIYFLDSNPTQDSISHTDVLLTDELKKASTTYLDRYFNSS